MYSDLFELEGLVSSPSFGNGSKEEIVRMIDLYSKDYPQLKKHNAALMSPETLKALCKQGRRGLMPYKGYGDPNDPQGESWGGSFEPIRHSSRRTFRRQTTERASLMPMTISWAPTGTPTVLTARSMKVNGKGPKRSASGARTYLKTGHADGIGWKINDSDNNGLLGCRSP